MGCLLSVQPLTCMKGSIVAFSKHRVTRQTGFTSRSVVYSFRATCPLMIPILSMTVLLQRRIRRHRQLRLEAVYAPNRAAGPRHRGCCFSGELLRPGAQNCQRCTPCRGQLVLQLSPHLCIPFVQIPSTAVASFRGYIHRFFVMRCSCGIYSVVCHMQLPI